MEVVFFNGNIYTLDSAKPVVEALSAGGGRIIETGSSSELLTRLAPGTPAIDLRGRTVIPGLTDAHAHFLGFAQACAWLDLGGTSALEDVVALVAARVGSEHRDAWILGRGWDQNDWRQARYPGKAELDSVAPGNPVYLVRVCGHAAYANSRALLLAGVTKTTPDPAGGKIVRDGTGEPTGILIEDAMDLVAKHIPPLTREEKKELLVAAAKKCLASGLVGVHEMGISGEDVSLYREMFSERALPFRITAYLSSGDPERERLLNEKLLRGFADDHFSIVGVKFLADGSLGARSAALLSDYSDDPGNRGILLKDAEWLYREMLRCHEKGFQVAVHAIGDAAVREVLDIYERMLSEHPSPDMRHRIEHAQVVSPRDVPRFATLGVIPSMQFTHCTSDMPWAEARLGPERIRGAYAWRSLVRAGSRIPGGSDFPVESIRPLLGIYAAVTRRDVAGKPDGGWLSEQCLTVDEAVRGFTIDAAYAAHAEREAGTLTPGKLADCIVISDDIFSVRPADIPKIEILATILGGEIVHRSNAF